MAAGHDYRHAAAHRLPDPDPGADVDGRVSLDQGAFPQSLRDLSHGSIIRRRDVLDADGVGHLGGTVPDAEVVDGHHDQPALDVVGGLAVPLVPVEVHVVVAAGVPAAG